LNPQSILLGRKYALLSRAFAKSFVTNPSGTDLGRKMKSINVFHNPVSEYSTGFKPVEYSLEI